MKSSLPILILGAGALFLFSSKSKKSKKTEEIKEEPAITPEDKLPRIESNEIGFSDDLSQMIIGDKFYDETLRDYLMKLRTAGLLLCNNDSDKAKMPAVGNDIDGLFKEALAGNRFSSLEEFYKNLNVRTPAGEIDASSLIGKLLSESEYEDIPSLLYGVFLGKLSKESHVNMYNLSKGINDYTIKFQNECPIKDVELSMEAFENSSIPEILKINKAMAESWI